jgi:hypothetical protein
LNKPSEEEIYRAHDILAALLYDISVQWPPYGNMHISVIVAHQTLCWILGHKNGENFIENMVAIEATLSEQGIIFKRDPNA